MTKIKIMDTLLANKIAAGEVVERSASVVKELVENSIDAKATEIKIELVESGIKKIKIIDNGVGMDEEDAVLSFSRHATSKINDEHDLYHINTLGFRGEALASIASVSKITLQTSTGEVGTIVELEGGRIVNVTKGDARKGTNIAVNNLFYNTPARLKYLKSLYTELSNITSYVNKIALSYPNIKFTLINNDNLLLKTDGSGNLLKVIMAIYGVDTAKKMLEVSGNNDDYEISGYISNPQLSRSNRNHVITLVNGRVVRNIDLNKAINDAYHTYKPDNLYPIVVLNIEVDPILIDVNIHPTKQDIKFSKIEELLELVKEMVSKRLKQTLLIPKVEIKNKQLEKNNYIQNNFNFDEIKEDSTSYSNSFLNQDVVHELEQKEVIDNKEPIKIVNEERATIPPIYPIGSVHGTYIVCHNEQGMYLIDQHAAKERINYELFKKKLGNPNQEKVDLLLPLTVELSNDEFIILKENFNLLEEIGIEIEEFGINSIIVKAHPTWLPKNYEEQAIKKIIELIILKENNFSIEKFNEKIATTLSCKLSIKANENISISEMEYLIEDLRKCDNPYNCPHGRPTVIYYSKYDLEKLFKRTGF